MPGLRDWIACAVLSAVWLAPALFIGVAGDFPLNDDWAYAHTARVLLETGTFERVGWTWAPILTHSAVGALFAALFGFSFESLRLSGLFMGWLGVLGAWVLCRQLGASRTRSLLGAATVGFNPIYLNLSYTFMTDVPFAALVTWSLALLARGLVRKSPAWMAAGLAFGLAATLSRQLGVAVPVAFAGVLVATNWPRLPRWLLVAGGVLCAGGLYAIGATATFSGADGDYSVIDFLVDMLQRPGFVSGTIWNSVVTGVYLGLFVSPVAVSLATASELRVRGSALAALLLTPPLMQMLWSRGRAMPLGQNVLYDFGIGPATLAGAYDAVPHAPAWAWWSLTAFAIAAAAFALGMLAAADLRRPRALLKRPERGLLALFFVLYLIPQIASQNFFDRYLLAVLPVAVALLGSLPGRRIPVSRAALVSGAVLLLALALFGVLGTRDYLEHNRTRWQLVDIVLGRGVAPEDLEAGFEFAGWHVRDREAGDFLGRRGIYVDDYVISHEARIPGYRALETRSFRRARWPGEEVLTLFEKRRR